MLWFHNHGFGNAGATFRHLIPDYGCIIREGWQAVHAELICLCGPLGLPSTRLEKGGQLARDADCRHHGALDLAAEYSKECIRLAVLRA